MSDAEKQFDDMAKAGGWGSAERFARLVQFLVVEGRVRDFLCFVQADEGNLDAYLAGIGPEAFEREVLRYLDESGACLAGLQAEARESPACDTRDHF